MAVLSELFLILAGFDSGVSQVDDFHPAEIEIFHIAESFGKQVSTVSEATANNLEHPLCRMLKKSVSLKYLDELANLETRVISQVKQDKLQYPTADFEKSLYYASDILANTVDKWQDIFDFAMQMLSHLNETTNVLSDWILDYTLRHASVPGIRELGTEAIHELDMQWVETLSSVLIDGEKYDSQFLEYRNAPESSLIEDVATGTRQLSKAADTDLNIMEKVLELEEQNEKILGKEIEIPLRAEQVTGVLLRVQRNIYEVVKTHYFEGPEVAAMMTILRSIVLMGSSAFATDLWDARGDTQMALDMYLDVDKELDTKTSEMVPDLLQVAETAGGVTALPLKISLTTSLQFVFTSDQCVIYESLFVWMSKLAMAMESIGFGRGSVAHAYKLFFNTLWGYYQGKIDDAFSHLHSNMLEEGSFRVRKIHDKVLKQLVLDLMLDSREYRKMLETAIDSCLSDNIEPLRQLAHGLHGNPRCQSLDLAAFQGL